MNERLRTVCEWITGKLAITWCRAIGSHQKLIVTSEDRTEIYIACPFCKRREHGWKLDFDRRFQHRIGTPYVQKVVTELPFATLERLARLDRRKSLLDRRVVHRAKPDRRKSDV